MPRWLRYSILLGGSFAAVALFGLAISLFNAHLFERYFPLLLVLNTVIAAILFFVVVTMCVRLRRRWKLKQFGSHMTAKLALTTALISVTPTLTVYSISTAFISRSMNDSFSVQVEEALNAGVHITQDILAKHEQNTQTLAKQFAQSLASTPPSLMMHDLLKLLENHSGTEALVMTNTGRAVAAAGSRINVLMPDLPSPLQLKTAKTAGIYSVVDGDTLFEAPENTSNSDLRVRVIVPIPTLHNTNITSLNTSSLLSSPDFPDQFFLQITQPIEKNVALNASKLIAGYRDYQQSTYSRQSMATLYGLTLSLIVLFAVFASIGTALSFARKTVSPVMQLEKGTKRVSTGDFMPIREFPGGDEINILTRSFNSMIREVSEARHGLELQRLQAEQSQAFLERVLGNISSGVIVVDRWYTVVTANNAARHILGEDNITVGVSLKETLPQLVYALEKYIPNESEGFSAQPINFELVQEHQTTPIYIKSSPMPLGTQTGAVLVFDDVTPLIKAQRATAWGEVARRLAHEIKNPLTPIRLAAERLEWKLKSKLTEEKDLNLLHRTIDTIITQVDTLKQMVNDFREYAKLPSASLQTLALNDFVESTLVLYHDAGHNIKFIPESNLPDIQADPTQLRQVLHNLISNCLEASNNDQEVQIFIKTETLKSKYHADAVSAVKLSIVDNGPGFSDKILNSAFEPYVTTKATGTGLGLPMVKKILDDHGATITLKNLCSESSDQIIGAEVEMIFKASQLTPHPIKVEQKNV